MLVKLPPLLQSRRVRLAAVAVLGLGLGAAAFGLVPRAADAPLPAHHWVQQSVTPHADLGQQVADLADGALELTRGTVMRRGESLDTLLQRLGVADPEALQFLRSDAVARRLMEGRPDKAVQAVATRRGQLLSLTARFPGDADADRSFRRLRIQRTEQGWASALEVGDLQAEVRLGSGTIQSSLFAASDDAGIPDPIASQMAEIFSGEIDFHRQLRKGDTFAVVYEALTADGEPIHWNQGAGRVLAAEFVNAGKTHQAVWFEEGNKGRYFDFAGQSRQRAFLASPLAFSRVTSGFALRFHPVHQRWMAHTGIDYAAPTGTPARTVADGTVEFAGWRPEYGNTVIVRHAGDRSTWYAHLSRVDVRKGAKVTQGQTVGAVGATGTATGPHLHFELRIRDKYVDPSKNLKDLPSTPVAAAARKAFDRHSQELRVQLDAATTLASAKARSD